jgi:hypothetical protein
MKRSHVLFGAVTVLAVVSAGCESDDGIARREREKPAAYASLHVWQKRFIEKGVIAKGFTPDMVYMAMGNPSIVKKGTDGELWTYKYYYAAGDLSRARYHYYEEQGNHDRNIVGGMLMEGGGGAGAEPHPAGSSKGGVTPFAFRGGPPQGGSMEPADLQSYTVLVLFQEGKATRIGVTENFN